jgi:hypothetical protein
MSYLKFTFYLIFGIAFSSCSGQEEVRGSTSTSTSTSQGGSQVAVPNACSATRTDDSAIRILFVGNSLTYSNNLPKIVESIGAARGKSVFSETLAFGNYAIEDHWNDGKMQKLICEGNFDFVVIQQGPSSQSDGRVMLFDYGQRFKDICSSRGTELAFFMVWPAKENYHTFSGVIRHYTDAANDTKSLLCAVGSQFKKLGNVGDFRFYSPDNFHPSVEGSEIAAEIIYSTLVEN